MKKTAILLCEGFEEVEALTVVDLLRRDEIVCDMLSVAGTDTVLGGHGIVVTTDGTLEKADMDSYDAVILPGGLAGVRNLIASDAVTELLQNYQQAGKLIAAICAAPTVLGHIGLLEGKCAVCYPGMEPQLTGATIGTHTVEVDGNFITSRGLGTAIDFSLAIISYLDCDVLADQLAEKIVYSSKRNL